MSSRNLAIRVEGLSKCYQIYDSPRDRLKQFAMPRFQQILGLRPRQYFREFWALKEVSFELKKGETVAIIGRNGSGKSTLLQLICGTLTPTTGTIETYGRVAALLELGSGFNPEFTGRENVFMNAAVIGLSKEEIDAHYDDIIAFADIGDFIEQPVKTYSSGMLVRLAFAVIAHVKADILIIDEALAVGDIFFTQKCMRFLHDFRKHGTVLLVTHDTNSVLSFCDRALWLEGGRQRALSNSKSVCESYLADLYANNSSSAAKADTKSISSIEPVNDFRDIRQDFINSSSIRNDIEVFRFQKEGESFGTQQVKITDAYISDIKHGPVSWFVGGEIAELNVVAHTNIPLKNPIVGFSVKDKRGQHLFGDNTFLVYRDCSIEVIPDQKLVARFRFRMPLMPSGDYIIGIAIADGTQESHVVHQWIHDAIVFRSHSDSVATGLIGIPMLEMELNKHE